MRDIEDYFDLHWLSCQQDRAADEEKMRFLFITQFPSFMEAGSYRPGPASAGAGATPDDLRRPVRASSGRSNAQTTVTRAAAVLVVSVIVTAAACPPVEATERWFLMSRHGDCAAIGSLQRKIPDLGSIDDPQSFAAFMRRKGYQVALTPTVVPAGKVQDVRVPEKDLFLLFVTSELCSGPGTPTELPRPRP